MGLSANAQDPKPALIVAADRFAAEIAGRADEIETLRSIPPDLAARLAEAGLYQVCTPASLGGGGQPPRVYAEIVERLAQADASTGWCVFIGISTAFGMAHGQTPDLREILRRPGLIAAGAFAPSGRATPARIDGQAGYRVTGHWQWGSGSRNAQWIGGGVLVLGEDGKPLLRKSGIPLHLMAMLPATEVELLDTWHVMGLCGTGSTDFTVTDVFVPAGRMIDPAARSADDAAIFAFPYFGMLAIGIAAVALGSARAALDDLLGFAAVKIPQGQRNSLADRPSTHKDVAKAEALLRSARAFLYEAIDAAWQAATIEQAITLTHRRDLRLATTHAVDSAKSAIDLVYSLAGGTAPYDKSPIQRRFRDVHVAAQHMMVNASSYELAGRAILKPDDPKLDQL